MGSINAKAPSGTLFFDFRYRGKRCKEYTKLKDSPQNRRRLSKILERIEAEITLGTFDYGAYFPNSKRLARFAKDLERVELAQSGMPSFGQFGETWYAQKRVEWRDSHADTVRITLDAYLIPAFGNRPLTSISKSDLLDFRVDV
jgi:integrase